jgi:hypothetical protein
VRWQAGNSLSHSWDEGRRRDWQHWAINQITEADFVVIVASPACREVGDGTYRATDRGGIRSELDIIRNILHQHPKWQDYLLPVVLPGESIDNLPLFLRPQTVDHFLIKETHHGRRQRTRRGDA